MSYKTTLAILRPFPSHSLTNLTLHHAKWCFISKGEELENYENSTKHTDMYRNFLRYKPTVLLLILDITDTTFKTKHHAYNIEIPLSLNSLTCFPCSKHIYLKTYYKNLWPPCFLKRSKSQFSYLYWVPHLGDTACWLNYLYNDGVQSKARCTILDLICNQRENWSNNDP